MKELFVHGVTLPEAYHNAILELHRHGDVVTCGDWGQLQKEAAMTFVAERPLQEPMVSRLYIGGFYELQQYVMEVLDGILDFKMGEEHTWGYTYHDRLVNHNGFNQIEFIVNELKRRADSRRAVAMIRDNKADAYADDPACLQHMQFFIRGGLLHCKVLMRSNDAAEASFMNAFAFVMLQRSIADALGVGVGSYAHRANSYHAYEKDFGLLQQYADGIMGKPFDELTYEYEGFYRELMEESVPKIMEQVGRLKKSPKL